MKVAAKNIKKINKQQGNNEEKKTGKIVRKESDSKENI